MNILSNIRVNNQKIKNLMGRIFIYKLLFLYGLCININFPGVILLVDYIFKYVESDGIK